MTLKPKMGPNMRALTAERAAQLTVGRSKPTVSVDGTVFGAVAARMLEGGAAQDLRDAVAWVKLAIVAVRNAALPNPWRKATDEEICGEVLRLAREVRAGGKVAV